MPVAAGPDTDRPRPSRRGRGQGTKQARGDARPTVPDGWPPRWLTTLTAGAATWEGDLLADFIAEHGRITEDSFAGPAGNLIAPRSWQREAIRHIFARHPVTGRRLHRLAIYSTPRKNGKTSIGAPIGLGQLTCGDVGGQVILAANDKDQARILFRHAKEMVTLDPELSEEIKPYRDALEHLPTGSVLRAISAEAYTKEGLSPTLVLYDELHGAPTRDLFDVLQLAMGARIDPLMLILSTAGVMSTRTEDESILYQLYQHGLSVIRGEVEDPTFAMVWWGADEADDHLDEAVWAKANPGLGDILDIEDLRSKVRITPEAEFRTKRLNIFTPVADFWIPAGAWEKCQEGEPDERDPWHDLNPKLPVAVGIDVAIVHDASAVVVAQRSGDTVTVRGRYWMNPHPPDTRAHADWRMPLDEITEVLRYLRKRFPASAARVDGMPVPGPAYVYDRYGLASTELTLEAERGYALIPIAQQGGWMVEASRRFYEAVLDGRIAHDGDPTLTAHLRNVVPRQVAESGWRLEKASRTKKIDAAVAAVMAVSQALEEPPKKRFAAFAA